jgi:hypothetical protein
VLRDRQLRDLDREYLEAAMRVVTPVDDLPIQLPAGRRDSYPVDEAAMRALAERYGVRDACTRLMSAMRRLGSTR